ncbi:glycosyltransferase [Candidatus Parcubacteria bacterium]|nr:MAG: glycosyltransferase [Candidatus Parcubacteria bacterium]
MSRELRKIGGRLRANRVFLVLPAHNESQGLQFTVSAFAGEAERLNKSGCLPRMAGIVIVDDGSTDATWHVIEDMQHVWTEKQGGIELHGLRLSRNFGKEPAILAGIERAYELGADAVVIADADLQHPPEVLGRLLEAFNASGADVVEGVKRDRGRESVIYRLLAKTFYALMTRLTGLDMRSASDYRLLSKRAMETLLAMPERSVFFRGMSSWIGFKREKVEFDVRNRHAGTSTWSPFRLIGLAARAVTAYSSAPLRVVTFFGGVFMVFAALMAAQTLWRYWAGEAVTGFATVILLILITSSLLMLSLGIIGEYLARIYDEVKQRPRYIVSDKVDVAFREQCIQEEAGDRAHG